MPEDWEAVARAVNARAAELRLTQRQLAERSGLGIVTIRSVQNNYTDRRSRGRTLVALSEALGWPSHYLDDVLAADSAAKAADETAGDPVLGALEEIRSGLLDVRTRLDAIEGTLNANRSAAGDADSAS